MRLIAALDGGSQVTFNPDDSKIKRVMHTNCNGSGTRQNSLLFVIADAQDIIAMIIQYLHNEGYTASMMTLQDEANIKLREHVNKRKHTQRLKTSLLGTPTLSILVLKSESLFYLIYPFLAEMRLDRRRLGRSRASAHEEAISLQQELSLCCVPATVPRDGREWGVPEGTMH